MSTIEQLPATTSEQWWHRTCGDEARTIRWLQKQYHGEVTGADIIFGFADDYAVPASKEDRLLRRIGVQEQNHAEMVGDLLVIRGIEPAVLDKPERYWHETFYQIGDLATAAAVTAHAEHMSLERIEAIIDHPDTDSDIRRVFEAIYPDELFHTRAFACLAGRDAMAATLPAHNRGRVALGLAPERIQI